MALDQHIDSINQAEQEQDPNSSKGLTSPTSLTSPSPSKGGGQERGGH